MNEYLKIVGNEDLSDVFIIFSILDLFKSEIK